MACFLSGSSFGGCCEEIGVVARPWWFYLLLVAPIELILVRLDQYEEGSVGERKSTRGNLVFAAATLVIVIPLVLRIVRNRGEGDGSVCGTLWECYELFVFGFANSMAAFTTITLIARIVFKRYFHLLWFFMLKGFRTAGSLFVISRWWGSSSMESSFADEIAAKYPRMMDWIEKVDVLGIFADPFFACLKFIPVYPLLLGERESMASLSDFLSFEKLILRESPLSKIAFEDMQKGGREGTFPGVEHFIALLFMVCGGFVTHTIPGLALYLPIFAFAFLTLVISHALRVGLFQNQHVVVAALVMPFAAVSTLVAQLALFVLCVFGRLIQIGTGTFFHVLPWLAFFLAVIVYGFAISLGALSFALCLFLCSPCILFLQYQERKAEERRRAERLRKREEDERRREKEKMEMMEEERYLPAELTTSGFLGDAYGLAAPRLRVREHPAVDGLSFGSPLPKKKMKAQVEKVVSYLRSEKQFQAAMSQLKRIVLFDASGNVVLFGTTVALISFVVSTNLSLLFYNNLAYYDALVAIWNGMSTTRFVDCTVGSFSLNEFSFLGVVDGLLLIIASVSNLLVFAVVLVRLVDSSAPAALSPQQEEVTPPEI